METIAAAWDALRSHLDARARELVAEVRAYPGPIARCDDQLPRLLEERTRALEAARRAAELDAMKATLPDGQWRARVARMSQALELRDAAGESLQRRLAEALHTE